jgi:hypothetical protein
MRQAGASMTSVSERLHRQRPLTRTLAYARVRPLHIGERLVNESAPLNLSPVGRGRDAGEKPGSRVRGFTR